MTTLPSLPLAEWMPTKTTLHLWLQIIGKIRLKLTPRKNHWWYITEYITAKGISTGTIPYGKGAFEILLDFRTHELVLETSWAGRSAFPLADGLSVAQFYRQLMQLLQKEGIEVSIVAKPFDMGIEQPFAEIVNYHSYDKKSVHRFWDILLWVDSIMKRFSGRFYGKTCPVHLYWHHMDLTITRFSGRKGPPVSEMTRISDKDAYTHEVISFGFWVGDENVPAPAFYAYAYPSPEGIDEESLMPQAAKWIDANGSPMALLMYDDIRELERPGEALLEFMESAYQAGAKKANWDIDALTVPPLEEM